MVARHVVTLRPDQGDVVGALGAIDQLVEPATGDDGVVVEQADVLAASCGDSLIHTFGETEVLLVADDLGVGHGGEVLRRAVSRTVINENQLEGPGRVSEHALNALARVLKFVPRQHDDRHETVGGLGSRAGGDDVLVDEQLFGIRGIGQREADATDLQ